MPRKSVCSVHGIVSERVFCSFQPADTKRPAVFPGQKPGGASLLQIELPWERAPSNHSPEGTPNAVSGQNNPDVSIRNYAVTVKVDSAPGPRTTSPRDSNRPWSPSYPCRQPAHFCARFPERHLRIFEGIFWNYCNPVSEKTKGGWPVLILYQHEK
jgi:hypothetical protein